MDVARPPAGSRANDYLIASGSSYGGYGGGGHGGGIPFKKLKNNLIFIQLLFRLRGWIRWR